MTVHTSSSTQAAPATASKVEKSSIMSGATSPTSNVGNTDNGDAIPEELDATTDATQARMTYVGRTKVVSVALNKSTTSIVVNATETLTKTFTPSSPTISTGVWTTSNAAKATVSSSGVVTAVAVGTAVITFTADDLGASASCTVTVTTE